MPTHVIAVDLAKVRDEANTKDVLRILAWGDVVDVIDQNDKQVRIKTVRMVEQDDGSVKPKNIIGVIKKPSAAAKVVVPIAENRVLKVNFVDVQQGDGTVIETPGGKVMLVDGGDNQLFARYLAARYRNTTKDKPLKVDCILVSHGDADHFLGLTEFLESEKFGDDLAYKRLFIKPQRVFHNGLVKRASNLPDEEQLGTTTQTPQGLVITELVDDLVTFPAEKMNLPFKRWRKVLETYEDRYGAGSIKIKRLAQGDDAAFDFLTKDEPLAGKMKVEVLGPIVTEVGGKPGLRFLGEPPDQPAIDFNPDQPGEMPEFKGNSPSHTINGHSVIIRLTYGDFRFLLAGDLNQQAEIDLVKHHAAKLEAEVLKAPHHGSADFSVAFIKAVSPVISAISSGDESERKEYIHPRASLVGALGRFSRLDRPLIFITELAAFFEMRGYVGTDWHQMREGAAVKKNEKVVDLADKKNARFFSFNRSAFGIVKIRTDGKRLLVYTDSGNVQMKEAYAFEMSGGKPKAVKVVQA